MVSPLFPLPRPSCLPHCLTCSKPLDKQHSPTAASTPSSTSHNFSSLIKFSPNHTNNPPPKPKPYLITPLPLAEAATTAELSLSPSRLRRCSIDRSPGRTPQRPKNHHSKHASTHDSVLLQALKSRFPSVYNLHLLSERRKSISSSTDVASSKSNLTTYALPSPSSSCAPSSSLSPSSSFLLPSSSPCSQQTTEDSIFNTSKPSPAASPTIDESPTPKKKKKQRKDKQNNKIRKDKIGVSPQGSAIKKQRRGSDALYAHLLRGARITASAHQQQKASELTSVALPSPSNSRTQSVVSQNEHNENGREQGSNDATSKQHEEHPSTPFSPFSSPLSISLTSAWKSAPPGVEAEEETTEVGQEEKEQTQQTAKDAAQQPPEENSGAVAQTKKQKRFSRQIVSPTPAATASSSSFLHYRPSTLRVRSKKQGGSGPASTLRKALSRGNHFSSTAFSSDKYDHLAFYNESDEESVHPSQEECSSSSSASSLEVAAALLHHQLSSSSSPSSSAAKKRQADAIKPNPSLTTTTGSSSPSGKSLAKAFGSTAKRLKTSALAVNSNKNNDSATSSAKKKKRTRKNKKMRNKNKNSVANKENIGC
ncbi:hypothetical protein QOT17_008898 [Balamuthia mandrillaris]